jgi:maltose/moltooligosaccharide transporter
MKELKLNYRNTLFIGFGFFSILMLWQIYNTYTPIFLGRLLSETGEVDSADAPLVGFIMALDNFFALFMLPLFGILSDRTKTKFGRRMPYIIIGMFVASILFPLIAVAYILNSLVGLIMMMLLILIVMNVYRNPAVALMPDVTPKPLRSKANGIINLIGYVGAIIGGGLVIVFGESAEASFSTVVPFLIVSGVMLVAMIVLFIKIKENQIVEETKEDMKQGELLSTSIDKIGENIPLSKSDKKNMLFILLAVFLWFAAFNSIETFISSYSENVLNNFNIAGTITIILVISSMITFIPAGYLAGYIGRKFTVILGLALMAVGLLVAMAIHAVTAPFFLGIAVIGVGWALINVNSYPMMFEMSHKNNVGRYTGFYYTSSMLAQSFTPIVAGAFISSVGNYNVLFPYALVLTLGAFIVFFFVKEKKNVAKEIKKGLDAFDVE